MEYFKGQSFYEIPVSEHGEYSGCVFFLGERKYSLFNVIFENCSFRTRPCFNDLRYCEFHRCNINDGITLQIEDNNFDFPKFLLKEVQDVVIDNVDPFLPRNLCDMVNITKIDLSHSPHALPDESYRELFCTESLNEMVIHDNHKKIWNPLISVYIEFDGYFILRSIQLINNSVKIDKPKKIFSDRAIRNNIHFVHRNLQL